MAEFTLTTNPDDIVGTADDDLITGGPGTLQTEDSILGGGGEDTLVADAEQNGAQAPTIEDVENIFVDTGGLDFDISNILGANRIIADTSSTTFIQIGSDDLDYRFGARDAGSGTVTLDFVDGDIGKRIAVKLEAISSNVTFKAPTDKENRAVKEVDLVLTGDTDAPSVDGDVQVDLSAFNKLETLTLSGDAASKVVIGSKKIDLIDATETTGGVTVNADTGNSVTVLGGSGDDDFKTGNGGDTIETGAGDDVVNAGSGDNDVKLGSGDDTFESEGGNDTVEAGSGDDVIKSGGGDDTIFGGEGNDVINGEGNEDTIYGGAGNDEIDGGNNDDMLYDGDGDDFVFGGGGSDTLVVGSGNDVLDGGAGADVFDFRTNSDLGDDTVGDSNKFAVGTDEALLLVGGVAYDVSTEAEWRALNQEQDDLVVVDSGAQQVRVDIDNGGVVTFNLDNADFFEMA